MIAAFVIRVCSPLRPLVIAALAACTAAPVAAPAVAPPAAASRWLAISLAGTPVGRGHELVEPQPGGGYRTHVAMAVRIGRLGKAVELASDVTFDEDRDGRLRGLKLITAQSRQATTAEVAFGDRVATIREAAGEAVHTRTVVLRDRLWGPEAIRRANAERLRAPGDALAYPTWSPELAAPLHMRCTVEAIETLALEGAAVRVVRVAMDGGEGQRRTAWLDADGREVRSALTLPLGTMVATQVAAEPAMPPGQMAADAFARTMIRSNVRLPRARALDRLVLRVAVDPGATLPALEAADERIVRRDAAGAVIQIDRVQVGSGADPAPVGREMLAATPVIDPSAAEVRAIAAEALAGATDPWERAQRLTRWVTEHMAFDAGLALTPAVEVARDRRGTCAAYAVLLASLLRAAEIPSRMVMGLVYAQGVFAGHAWVEARIGGAWVPLDAAIWNRRDALVLSQHTADFLVALRTRQDRRERVPRFLAWFVAGELGFAMAFFAIVAPGWIPRAAAIYAAMAALLAPVWFWYRRRLRRQRAQLDALLRAAE